MKIVPTKPITSPALKKALGMARIPVPKLPFSRWISVSVFLWENEVITPYQLSSLHVQFIAFCCQYFYHPVSMSGKVS